MSLILLAVLALAPVAPAQQSPAEPAATKAPSSDPNAPLESLPQAERLRLVADLLQQLSDEEYLKSAPAGGKPFRASRAEAISAVYGTLAALEYQTALKAGPAADEKPRVEAALQAKLKDADALAVNPDTLEEAGWWSSFNEYLNQDPEPRARYGTVVMAVRGGRSLDTEAEKKAVKLKKAVQEAEARLAKPDLPAAEKAALHFEEGKLYDELAACGLGKAAAETDFSALETKLNELADLLQRVSDEDYRAVAAKRPEGQAGSFRLIRPTRAEAISAAYGALATLQFYQALNAGPEEKERPEYQAEFAASARTELGVDPAGIEETGYWSNLWTGLNQGSSEGYSGFRGAAVAAVRGGRTIDTEAERTAAKLKKELQEVTLHVVRNGHCVNPRSKGRIYRRLATCGLGIAPVPEAPKAEVVKESPAPEPAAPAVDEVKAGTAELDRMGQSMQREIDKRRAPAGSSR
ncbi:MAG: hypothetical protein HY926_05800 [Elusimicrobia bacterium]|nr:hypothetical protein [Elusimicrobiota bacterium]